MRSYLFRKGECYSEFSISAFRTCTSEHPMPRYTCTDIHVIYAIIYALFLITWRIDVTVCTDIDVTTTVDVTVLTTTVFVIIMRWLTVLILLLLLSFSYSESTTFGDMNHITHFKSQHLSYTDERYGEERWEEKNIWEERERERHMRREREEETYEKRERERWRRREEERWREVMSARIANIWGGYVSATPFQRRKQASREKEREESVSKNSISNTNSL